MFHKQISPAVVVLGFSTLIASCSKETTNTPGTNPCAGKTIVVTADATAATNCGASNAQITAAATGSTGFTFKLDNGAYQTIATFNNVTAGSHTVFAKDAAGCEQSAAVTVNATGAGPKFLAVKSLINAQCQSCHNSSNLSGGMNLSTACNIVDAKTRIKVRAVDEGTMPQGASLSQAQKNIIINWISAGGRFSD